MGRLVNRLTDWWRRRQISAPRIDSVMRFEMQHEAPASIPRHALILIGTEQHPKWAAFECPCGTGHKIMVSLVPTHPRNWRLELANGRPTLLPSIDYSDEHGRCHFWLRDGRIEFTRDSIRPHRRRSITGGKI